MKNEECASVKDSLIDLIAKIGEKITLRRAKFFDKKMVLILVMYTVLSKKILAK